ncbi:MAG TPA: magnesium transporter [Candidatus Levybacteria bacterium]|nr:magnesium transporter [Candidatus Levybacteria bacterium]
MASVHPSKTITELIDPNVPQVHKHTPIKKIKELLLSESKTFSSVNYIYVTTESQKLIGVLSIQEALSLPNSHTVDTAMKTDVITAPPHARKERVAHLALKHTLKAIPIVDKDNIFLGIISSDDILKITNDEITEDLLLQEGINSREYAAISTLENPPLALLKKRLPWLIVGLGGGLLAAEIIGVFENLLENNLLLISFLPLMVYMSDAVGSQSQTIFIRHLAINGNSRFFTYFFKESYVGLLISLCLSVVLGCIVSVLHNVLLGGIVASALLLTIIVSVAIAILVPRALVQLGKDPAIASGPFATVLRDIISIVIYFMVSSFFLNQFI